MKTWSRCLIVGSIVQIAALLAGCNQNSAATTRPPAIVQSSASNAPPATPGQPQAGQEMFPTPEMAAATLKDAVLTHDRQELLAIFGQAGQDLIFTGDRVQQDNELDRFGDHLMEYASVQSNGANQAVLHVGKYDWPFPIPIVKNGDDWFFDTATGEQELLDRRIGEDELNAIGVCRVYVLAQREYASRPRMPDGVLQYAQHIMSQPGMKDGLYWPAGPGEALSPFGPLVAQAQEQNYAAGQTARGTGPHPYKGYIFHILKAQGPAAPGGAMDYVVNGRMTRGFAMVAYPSDYGSSGIMTFIVGPQGIVYQKDLGSSTAEIARAMTAFNPDATWSVVKGD